MLHRPHQNTLLHSSPEEAWPRSWPDEPHRFAPGLATPLAELCIPSDVRSWVEIDLPALQHNARFVRDRIGSGCQLLAVVKANAYGHGAIPVVQALAGLADGFGVANVQEAQEIAPYAAGKNILLLGPSLPAERRAALEEGFISSISSLAEAEAYSREAQEKPALLNFKIDTGMGRMGCPEEEAFDVLREIVRLPRIEVRQISTHLPVADEDTSYTSAQLTRFQTLSVRLHEIAPQARIHALNSGGILTIPQQAGQIARGGLLLYGSAYPAKYQPLLRPVMTWKARIVLVRDMAPGRTISYGRTFVTPLAMRVATLPLGYADGFPRQTSGRAAEVLVGGRRCPVLGRVTMDQILVDVSSVPSAEAGSEAVIIGRQGEEEILARELADHAGTIAWDIFTGLKKRVMRFYKAS